MLPSLNMLLFYKELLMTHITLVALLCLCAGMSTVDAMHKTNKTKISVFTDEKSPAHTKFIKKAAQLKITIQTTINTTKNDEISYNLEYKNKNYRGIFKTDSQKMIVLPCDKNHQLGATINYQKDNELVENLKNLTSNFSLDLKMKLDQSKETPTRFDDISYIESEDSLNSTLKDITNLDNSMSRLNITNDDEN